MFSRLFGAKTLTPEATAIDQDAYLDQPDRRQKRLIEDAREREADRDRIAVIVWTWARDCVNFGEQRPLPTAAVPSAIKSWIFGLVAQEVMVLASANDRLIGRHMYDNAPIAGVRAAQRLPRQPELRFPKPPAPVAIRRRLA